MASITLEQLLAESLEAQRIATETPRWATIAQFGHYMIRRCSCGTEAETFEGFYLYQKLDSKSGRGFRLVATVEADPEQTCESYTTLRNVGYCSECLAEVGLEETDPANWPLLGELGPQYTPMEPEVESEPEPETTSLNQSDILAELESLEGVQVIRIDTPDSVMQIHNTLQDLLGE